MNRRLRKQGSPFASVFGLIYDDINGSIVANACVGGSSIIFGVKISPFSEYPRFVYIFRLYSRTYV